MGYLIRMVPEVEEWLAAVRDRDPAAAVLIDEAVAALRAGGKSVGPPLVVPLDDPSLSARPDLDMSYQRQLETLTRVRRAVADVATSRKRLELQAGQLEQQIGKLGDQSRNAMEMARGDLAEQARARQDAAWEQLADLRRRYELRPGAPESADTRILFTVEPSGTAVLLAAGMESDWLRAWYTEAIANCRIRYQRE